MRRIIVVVALALVITSLVLAKMNSQKTDKDSGSQQTAADHGFFTPGDVKWVDAPNSLPPGAKVATLEGNPSQEGLFTMRLLLPKGYKIPPHWHPAVEHVTVISGSFNLGMGEKFDEPALRAMPVGTFAFMPPGTRHFAMAKGETVIQVHGVGPWKINYVNPADDPRNRK
ncbi:MAG TPA: cupin domain-containing protein [Pyrinomonadaceae bacterium]|jgi:quercetin dioxygenase-like cupin family protein|nr:cupin domain-containing protein [Pyrinomonadaceae bacterium]